MSWPRRHRYPQEKRACAEGSTLPARLGYGKIEEDVICARCHGWNYNREAIVSEARLIADRRQVAAR